MHKIHVLLSSQFKRIRRDSLLMMLMIYPILLTLLGRYLIPIIKDATLSDTFDLSYHYPALMIFFVILNPMLYGYIVGLMLIDEREDHTLYAISVLPVKMFYYMIAKSTMFILLSIVSGVLITWLIHLYPIPFFDSLLINLLASLSVPFSMFLINFFANNKVEGFAVMKGTGFLLIIPIIALYIPHPFHYIGGMVPIFWPAMAIASYYHTPTHVVMYLTIGTIYTISISIFLYKRVMKKILS